MRTDAGFVCEYLLHSVGCQTSAANTHKILARLVAAAYAGGVADEVAALAARHTFGLGWWGLRLCHC